MVSINPSIYTATPIVSTTGSVPTATSNTASEVASETPRIPVTTSNVATYAFTATAPNTGGVSGTPSVNFTPTIAVTQTSDLGKKFKDLISDITTAIKTLKDISELGSLVKKYDALKSYEYDVSSDQEIGGIGEFFDEESKSFVSFADASYEIGIQIAKLLVSLKNDGKISSDNPYYEQFIGYIEEL